MAVGECLASKAWPTGWRPPGTHQLSLKGPKVISHSRLWLCIVDDGTINIVLCIIIIIIIIILSSLPR